MLESLIAKLAESGPVAVILCLALLGGVAVWKELVKSWQARIEDQKAVHTVLDATAKSNLSIAVAIENRNQASETLARAQEATAREVAIVSRDLDRLATAIEAREKEDRERWQQVERALGEIKGRVQ